MAQAEASGPVEAADQADKVWRARASRDRAYAARRAQRAALGGKAGGYRAGRCGLALAGDVDADMHGEKRLIGGGYESCAWLGCAVCGRAIRARRAAEIIVSAHRWTVEGPHRSLVMLTLSPPHRRSDSFVNTYRRLDTVWRYTKRRQRWAASGARGGESRTSG